MKCIILAAGYATRLYPLTKNTAKPLLKVAGKSILEHILEKVERVTAVDEVYIVTNEKFFNSFVDWVNEYEYSKNITVINDETTTNDNRLGAIADIQYVIDKAGIDDELMVLAGDNLFDFELTDFVSFYMEMGADSITTHEINEIEEIKRTGVIEVDEDGKVVSFEEKPQHPKSNLAVPPFYIYQKETLPLIKQYIQEGNNPDAPGNFVPWLIQHKNVYAYKFEGQRYDIGTVESYERVQTLFF
ncbi:nucleotidyltransferase family protein [Evansella sp. AB-rgal1]|uniref:nucleotidyltransferase family protein n=1 Tax=Evansella sp. AB-rgal1 TaxID=3242696 RepID=UPI00359CE56E